MASGLITATAGFAGSETAKSLRSEHISIRLSWLASSKRIQFPKQRRHQEPQHKHKQGGNPCCQRSDTIMESDRRTMARNQLQPSLSRSSLATAKLRVSRSSPPG